MASFLRIVYRLASYAILPLSLLYIAFQVARRATDFRAATQIFVPETKQNFGNTIFIPEFSRSVFPEERHLFMTIAERFHNDAVSQIWPDVAFLELRRLAIEFTRGGRRVMIPNQVVHDPIAMRMVRWMVARVARPGTTIVNKEELIDLSEDRYERDFADQDAANSGMRLRHGLGVYAHYKFKTEQEPVRLPEAMRRRVLDKIARHSGVAEHHFCNTFLKADPVLGGGNFAGAGVDVWLDAARLVTARGYTVLLTGDCPVPTERLAEFEGRVLTAEAIGEDYWLFAAFAPTEATIFVGDNGGGAQFAQVNTVPMLVANAGPPDCTWARAHMLFKHYTDTEGNWMPYDRIVAGHLEGIPPSHLVTIDNSREEILEAVAHFLDNPGVDWPISDDEAAYRALWPAHSSHAISSARYAPSWVARSRMGPDWRNADAAE